MQIVIRRDCARGVLKPANPQKQNCATSLKLKRHRTRDFRAQKALWINISYLGKHSKKLFLLGIRIASYIYIQNDNLSQNWELMDLDECDERFCLKEYQNPANGNTRMIWKAKRKNNKRQHSSHCFLAIFPPSSDFISLKYVFINAFWISTRGKLACQQNNVK